MFLDYHQREIRLCQKGQRVAASPYEDGSRSYELRNAAGPQKQGNQGIVVTIINLSYGRMEHPGSMCLIS